MRASGRDDVIFSHVGRGTARNMAEVMVTSTTAPHGPPQFNELEFDRDRAGLEREAGSAYGSNGKDVRAATCSSVRDVSTGAARRRWCAKANRRTDQRQAAGAAPHLEERPASPGSTPAATRPSSRSRRLKRTCCASGRRGQLENPGPGPEAPGARRRSTERVGRNPKLEAASLYLPGSRRRTPQRERRSSTRSHASSPSTRAPSPRRAGGATKPARVAETARGRNARAAAVQRLTIERQSIEEDEARSKARRGEWSRGMRRSPRTSPASATPSTTRPRC